MKLKPVTFTFFKHESEWLMRVTNIEQLKYVLNMDYMAVDKAATQLMDFYLSDMTPEQTRDFLKNASSLTRILYTMYQGSGSTIGAVKDELFNTISQSKLKALMENHFLNVNRLGGYNVCDYPLTQVIQKDEPLFPKD